jgi:hypothetical protein
MTATRGPKEQPVKGCRLLREVIKRPIEQPRKRVASSRLLREVIKRPIEQPRKRVASSRLLRKVIKRPIEQPRKRVTSSLERKRPSDRRIEADANQLSHFFSPVKATSRPVKLVMTLVHTDQLEANFCVLLTDYLETL